jgi:peptidoglycan/xylan/chitin deacetylase (PgdA/CDA1 family)
MRRNVVIVLLSQLPIGIAALVPSTGGRWALAAAWAVAQTILLAELLRPRGRLFAPVIWKGPSVPRVALTFDDGPHPEDTPAILGLLAQAGVRATFFFVGEKARRHPALVRRAAEAGHEIGAHSDTHPWWFSLAPPGRVAREVEGSARTLESLAGRRPIHFRPPVGHKSLFLPDALEASGMRLVTWSSRSFDTLGRSPEAILKSTLATVSGGGIVLLHEGVRRRDGVSPTVAALPRLIAALRARGLEPVSLEDLRADPEGPARHARAARAAEEPSRSAR